MKKNKKAKKKNKKFSWKLFGLFMAFEVIFTAVTGPYILYYGPFENVKRTVVGTAMSTFKHQFIAKWFLSDAKIEEILNSNTVQATQTSNENQNTSEIKIPTKHDNNINRYDIQGKKFDGVLLEIKDPTRIKVGYTKKLGKEGQRTSQIAKDNGAVAAINGGGFTDKSPDGKLWAGTGGYPTGSVISGGKVIYTDGVENQKIPTMALTKEGLLMVQNQSINDMKKAGIKEAISFGPALIVNGKSQVSGDGGQGTNPRTAIGQKQDGTILLLVIDGRQALKPGATLREVEEIMQQYGAWNAINLDGGSSSTMYYNGKVINEPSDPLGERSVATAIYVTP